MSTPHDGSSQVPPHPEGYADDAHRYRLDSRIATGGMGEVWLATDETLGRRVAVKLLKTELADDAGFRTRFETEARNAARLQHPGVAGVYDYGQASPRDGSATPRPYLVMEYVDGQPLSDLLRPGSPMPPAVVVPLLAQAADAIGAAHAAGIVHRDVKPANLLVTADRTMKITDFGIARAAEGVALTQTGQVMGTPQYLAPEQAEGRQAVPASDVYSLACVAYECLMGARPFTGESSVAVALAHLREPVPQLGPDVPRDLAAVVERGLAKQPSERFVDGAAFARALRDPSSVTGAPAAAAPPASDSTSVMPAVAAGAAGAGLGAAAAAGSTRDTPAQRPAPTPSAYRTTHTEERPPGERRKKGVPGWLPAAVLAAAALLAILVVAIVFAGGDDTDEQPEDDRTPSDTSTPTQEPSDDGDDDPAPEPPPSEEPAPEPTPSEEPPPTEEPPTEEPSDTVEPTEDPVESTVPETGTDQGINERENLIPAPRSRGDDGTTPDQDVESGPENQDGEAP